MISVVLVIVASIGLCHAERLFRKLVVVASIGLCHAERLFRKLLKMPRVLLHLCNLQVYGGDFPLKLFIRSVQKKCISVCNKRCNNMYNAYFTDLLYSGITVRN